MDNTVNAARVLEDEAEVIRKRRENLGVDPDGPVLGVCFSGGGIRSATFNLGLTQGMSQSGVLPHADYLSTVSGGGYVGTWLHAVINRYCGGDPRNVKVLLSRPELEPHDVPERDPVAFLRKYSSYLATDIGLFSADFWVICGIWIRNILLNQMILVPFLAGISLITFLAGVINRSIVRAPLQMTIEIGITALLLILLVVFAGLGVGGAALAGDQSPGSPRDRWDTLSIGVVCAALILLSGLGISLASDYVTDARRVGKLPGTLPWLWIAVIMGCFFTGLFMVFQWRGKFPDCYKKRNGKSPGVFAIWYASLAGFSTGFLFLGAMKVVARLDELVPGNWNTVAWGPAVITVAILTGASLHIGLMGVDYDDNAREWLARLGALGALFVFAWTGLFAISVFGPWWVLQIAAFSSKLLAGVSGTWLITSLAGAMAGKSAKTGGKSDPSPLGRFLDLLVKVAPSVFILGYLLVISAGVHRALAYWWGSMSEMELLQKAPAWHECIACVALLGIAGIIVAYLPRRVDINEFSMHHFYKNRLVRCYLGAANARDRRPSPFTGFDPHDDTPLSSFLPQVGYNGPYPIYNTCLNLNRGSELAKRERKGSGFVFTPLYSGYDAPHSKWDIEMQSRNKVWKGGRLQTYGYRPTEGFGYPCGFAAGTCMAISGAAASPNGGYHTSGPMAFLMTLFNVRLGWWVGNTRLDLPSGLPGPRNALVTLLSELFAFTDARSNFLNLSDGGHFENLGLYELIRRKCAYIIAGDGEQDGNYAFESLGGAVRKCRTDFGAEITIDPRPIRLNATGLNGVHCVTGQIRYAGGETGTLLYLKASITGDESTDVAQYKASHPDFPQQTTANQFFTESQFESYRKLGLHVWETAIRDDPGGFFLRLKRELALVA